MTKDFDNAIKNQVEKLGRCPLVELERDVAEKRRQWLHDAKLQWIGKQPTPREAYELFMGHYLALNLDEAPVVAETASKIVWHSANPCPTLEACSQLGLDTRRICRAVYEKPTQVFLSAIDPTLRFQRSYVNIRPHKAYCEEWIVRLDFEALMRIAIKEAEQSLAEGNKGYGAVVVFDGEVIARAHDIVFTEGDPSLHAEVNAIRAACRAQGDMNLAGAVLLSTCEPCPMCASLAVWANITSIIFGASIEETRRIGKTRIALPAEEIISRSPFMVEVVGGILREECLRLYA